MSGLENRVKKAESILSAVGSDDQVYIDAAIDFGLGNENAFDGLPAYPGSQAVLGALIAKGLSRARNQADSRGPVATNQRFVERDLEN